MSATGSQARQLQRGGSRNEDGEGPSKFVFVDASDAKRMRSTETRRVIHQHAMKEIGKSRRRPKKNSTVVLDLQPLESTTCHVPPSSWWLGLWKWSGGCKPDPFLRYPIELDSNARELVAYGEFTPVVAPFAKLPGFQELMCRKYLMTRSVSSDP